MINLVIAYDDNDSELGGYFEDSFVHTKDVVDKLDFVTLSSIRGLDCTEANINLRVRAVNQQCFVFASFSHGDSLGECLLTENDTIFVGITNVSEFGNSLFYTTACNAALQLGKNLIDNDCFCFVGYKDSSWATYEDFYPIYIACENYALNEFLKTGKTIRQTYDEMQIIFDEQIKNLYDQDEILVAIEFEHNRDCLVLMGNEELTANHFHI
ncbi:MAG: hypothetical protein ACKVOQ_08875 [Cyclobacteriaceae bacterium]